MRLRPYQEQLKAGVLAQWASGRRNVVARLATGGGKSATLASIVADEPGAVCVIAHRQELVGQLCMALARFGVRHSVMAPPDVRRAIIGQQLEELGGHTFDPNSRVVVAGVDTLIRAKNIEAWRQLVRLWVVDECHHVLLGNKWGQGVALFPNARGLGVTATPERSDGKGIGREGSGPFEDLVDGPPERWLIEQGFLCDYRIVCPPSDLDMTAVKVTAGGDFNPAQAAAAVKKSHIVGDAVREYLARGQGQQGVTFAPDVAAAEALAGDYLGAGVPAAVLHGALPGPERQGIIRRLRSGELRQVVSCDIVSEGFDLPAVGVASFCRPTASEGLYRQQFGRVLRPAPGKAHALIIDHVGNVMRHGLPDAPRVWSLADRERRGSSGPSDAIPMRVCTAEVAGITCSSPYPRVLRVCPFCGAEAPAPVLRSGPEHVDGDLFELDADTLASMRRAAELALAETPKADAWAAAGGRVAVLANTKRHHERREALQGLQAAMAEWGGRWHAAGEDDRTIQRRFFLTFGVDVLSAQALGRKEAEALADKIRG